jgi:outer membrane lipoprotein SlyB
MQFSRGNLSFPSSKTPERKFRPMMRRYPLILCFLLLFAGRGLAQHNSWIITIATGDTLSGCTLVALEGDSLRTEWSGFPVTLPVESIRKLQYHRRSEFWRGAFYGSAVGALGGTLVEGTGAGTTSSTLVPSALGAVGGCLIGGLAADYLSRDDRYELANYNITEKKNVIRSLLLQPELQPGAGELR